MARSTRVKIVVAASGLAGVALLAGGGMAFAADPGDQRTTLEIVEQADTGSTSGAAHDGKDCPNGDSGTGQAADSR